MKAGSVSLLGLAVVAALVLVALVPQAMQAGQGIGSAVSQVLVSEEHLSLEIDPTDSCRIEFRFYLYDLDSRFNTKVCLTLEDIPRKSDFKSLDFWQEIGVGLRNLLNKGIITERMFRLIQTAIRELHPY